jgi:hypothetical protein
MLVTINISDIIYNLSRNYIDISNQDLEMRPDAVVEVRQAVPYEQNFRYRR